MIGDPWPDWPSLNPPLVMVWACVEPTILNTRRVHTKNILRRIKTIGCSGRNSRRLSIVKKTQILKLQTIIRHTIRNFLVFTYILSPRSFAHCSSVQVIFVSPT